jgi:phosphonopyruvate decarboxylase
MMKPEEILTLVAAARGTAICVPTMTTSPAWRTIAPDDLSVGCVGFMGGASALGLGLALGAPDRRVIVFDGDGSLLMQLGSLATIAGAAPRNFTHLLFKNGVYHTSGSQETPGGQGVDFAATAKAVGYRSTCTITSLDEFKKRLPGLLSEEGPIMAQLITGLAGSTPMNSPPGTPFHQQVANVHAKVAGARA